MGPDVLIAEVRKHIDAWIAAKPNRSMASLSRESGVSDSCLRRLRNSDSIPQSENLMRILVTVSNNTSIDGLKTYFSSESQILHFLLKNYSFLETATYIDQCTPIYEKEEHLKDYMSFAVFILSSNRVQTTKSEIQRIYGLAGELALESLEQNGFLKIHSTGAIETLIKDIRPSKELVKKHLPDLTKMFFKLEHESNCHILNTESVSKKGYGLLMDVFQKFLDDVGTVIVDHPGEVPVIIGGFMDSQTLEPYFKKEEAK